MAALDAVTSALEGIAPLRLAADWDAVGLLVAPRRTVVERVMTCLTLTADVAAEAAQERVDLVVSHHPLPFRPLARITGASGPGRVLLELIHAGAGVWSSHTAWDSAAGGINDQLAALLGLADVTPIEPHADVPLAGFGRVGTAPAAAAVADVARLAQERLGCEFVQLVGAATRPAGRLAIVCGSGGDLVEAVRRSGAATFLTGEIKLHQAVEAQAAGLAVIAVGHHASERFSMERLAARLADAVPGLTCWASRQERDPIAVLGREQTS
jgi:dinuclear metal center YbgI/SA1388 family protein